MIERIAKTIDARRRPRSRAPNRVSVIASQLVDAYRGSLLGISARTRALQVFSKGAAATAAAPVPAAQDPVAPVTTGKRT